MIALSEAERGSLVRDFSYQARTLSIIRNGFDGAPSYSNAVRDIQMICVGRIEQRKRQLELLHTADKLGLGVTFVGSPNPNQRPYTDRFASLVAKSRFSTWTGAVTGDEVAAMLRRSVCSINASWVEVQSLVDIEAVSAGCWVGCTEDGGSSAELLGAPVRRFGAGDLEGVLRWAASQSPPAPPGNIVPSWDDVARDLIALYQGL
ncbi:hypothetical protein GCM10012276_38190 [Nocardioides deserti]|nr:hypothetical protein GCM10012276_38190 [Nocardioides deserti]